MPFGARKSFLRISSSLGIEEPWVCRVNTTNLWLLSGGSHRWKKAQPIKEQSLEWFIIQLVNLDHCSILGWHGPLLWEGTFTVYYIQILIGLNIDTVILSNTFLKMPILASNSWNNLSFKPAVKEEGLCFSNVCIYVYVFDTP